MKFISQVEDVKLVMWDKVIMPDSDRVKDEVTGKTKFVDNGKKVEYTNYIFRDGFGEKLVAMSKDASYRALEGANVELVIEVTYNDFTKKNQVKLESARPVGKK